MNSLCLNLPLTFLTSLLIVLWKLLSLKRQRKGERAVGGQGGEVQTLAKDGPPETEEQEAKDS